MTGVPSWMVSEFRAATDPSFEGGESRPQKVKVKRGEEIFEGTDYPRQWKDFVGQSEAKEQLMVSVAGAKARGSRIEHTLLASGWHGIGKTTLATMLAFQADVGFVQTTGPLEVSKAKRLILSMKDHDILFIDEIHNMVAGSKAKAEWLLPFMTEGVLYTDEGAVECPKIAIVGATTDAGKLNQTILSRFMCKPNLVQYTADESASIAGNLAKRMGVNVRSRRDLSRIARAANDSPRDMRSILTAYRDLELAFPAREANLDRAIDWAGFSADGLSRLARNLLVVLFTRKDYTAASETLQSILGEPGPLRHHEQALMQRGLLDITGRGRQLTQAGVERAKQLGMEMAAAS